MSIALADEKRLTLYPWQADALQRCRPHGDTRWFAWFCGTGAGKTFAGAVWALQQHIAAAQRLAADATGRRKRPIGLIAAPTLASLRRHPIQHLLDITKGTIYEVRHDEARGEVRFPAAAGGGIAVCGSFDNKDTVRRMEGGQYNWIWLDEAAQTPDSAYSVLRARSAIYRAPILLSSYWYAPVNWCYREIWKRWEAGDTEVDVINLPTAANPAYPREEIEAARRTLDSALFEMRYGGKPTRMVGLVYGESWDSANPLLHCEPFDLPRDWRVITGGLDQGYSPSPFRLVMGAEDPATGIDYQFAEYASLATTTHEKAVGIVRLLLKYVPEARLRHFDIWGDPANKQGLADLKYELNHLSEAKDSVPRLAIAIHPADNAVESGIEAMTAALKTGRFRVMRGRCPHLVEEFGLYCRDSNSEIVKDDDHSVDAARYKVYSRKRQRDSRLRRERPAADMTARSRLERSERPDAPEREVAQHAEA